LRVPAEGDSAQHKSEALQELNPNNKGEVTLNVEK
jgi:hypothetical protein